MKKFSMSSAGQKTANTPAPKSFPRKHLSLFTRLGCGLMLGALTLALPVQNCHGASIRDLFSDWWDMSDAGFAKKYGAQAVSDNLTDQSTVAWMLFARLNRPVKSDDQTNALWETWKSNPETFPHKESKPLLKAASGVRRLQHLQKPKAEAQVTPHLQMSATKILSRGEEVTRNSISYNYIKGKKLDTLEGVTAFLKQGNAKVDMPIGAVEIKADWLVESKEYPNPGAYKYNDGKITYSLVGLHIMCKVAPLPSDPFHSESPSWFWTTFEYKDNPSLSHAQKLLTYNDALPPAKSMSLLAAAGLDKTPFANYRCNGTQIRYSDKKNPAIRLGNTTMEAFAGTAQTPPPQSLPQQANVDPKYWNSWVTSCHTCHAESSASRTTLKHPAFFPSRTGQLPQAPYNDKESVSFDFVWSIPLQVHLPQEEKNK